MEPFKQSLLLSVLLYLGDFHWSIVYANNQSSASKKTGPHKQRLYDIDHFNQAEVITVSGKESACIEEFRFDSWVRKILSEKRMVGNPLQYFLLRIPWQEKPGGLQTMELQESDPTGQSTHTHSLYTDYRSALNSLVWGKNRDGITPTHQLIQNLRCFYAATLLIRCLPW